MVGQRSVRRINPLGYRVVVQIVKEKDISKAGLYLPEGAKENMQESMLAAVVEVASAVDDRTHEETNVSGVPLGSLVLIPRDVGIKVPWDESLRIVETEDILATISEMNVV